MCIAIRLINWSHSYANEVHAYLKLHSGAPFFPKLLYYGTIICSSILQKGFVAILTKMDGVPFNDNIWRELGDTGRMQMEEKLKQAIGILRERCMWHGDATKSNVLYDSSTGNVVLLDFEEMQDNTEYQFGIEGPETISIMEAPFDSFFE